MGYVRDVLKAAAKVGEMAAGDGRGTLDRGETVKVAVGKLGMAVRGNGAQYGCTQHGRDNCQSCS